MIIDDLKMSISTQSIKISDSETKHQKYESTLKTLFDTVAAQNTKINELGKLNISRGSLILRNMSANSVQR